MRMLIAAATLVLCAPAKADITVGAFYDTQRQLPIAEANWYFRDSKFAAYGFLEAYQNPQQGYPPDKNVAFGKTWFMYDLSKEFAVGVELEYGYNNAGMYSRSRPFQPDQFRLIPKIGVSIKVQ